VNVRRSNGLLDRALKPRLVQVMAADLAGLRVGGHGLGGKDPEPSPGLADLRVLSLQGMRHLDAAVAGATIPLPQIPGRRELRAQLVRDGRGQHDDTVLVALGLPHHDDLPVEVDVLGAQAQDLHQAHAGAVQQATDDADLSLHGTEQASDFIGRQHGGNAARVRWPLQVVHPGKLGAEHLAVHEQQSAEGLVVRRWRNVPLRGKHGEEGLNLRSAHVARMLQAMPSNEEAHPVDVGLFGAKAIVQIAHPLAYLVQQAGGVQGGGRTGMHWQRWTV
jgi:hypothetical protein